MSPGRSGWVLVASCWWHMHVWIRSFTCTLEHSWSTYGAPRLINCHCSSDLSWAMRARGLVKNCYQWSPLACLGLPAPVSCLWTSVPMGQVGMCCFLLTRMVRKGLPAKSTVKCFASPRGYLGKQTSSWTPLQGAQTWFFTSGGQAHPSLHTLESWRSCRQEVSNFWRSRALLPWFFLFVLLLLFALNVFSVTVTLQKIKAVYSPRQKLHLQICIALLWRDSVASAKLAAADLWPTGCSPVGWN